MAEYNPFSLEGKTILITGASSGIGRQIAIECSKMGASVAITGRNHERLEQTLSEMEGVEHFAIPADLSNDDDIERLANDAPSLDGIVHCAGVLNRVLTKSVRRKDLDATIDANCYGPILLQAQLLKKKKVQKGASIVFIASRAPYAPSMGNGLYAASKGAILGYAKVLALELVPRLIRVNSILPAMVWTDLVAKDAEKTGGDYQEAQNKYPLKRFGRPEDVAFLAVYLLSDASAWMTGSCIDITGGGEGLLTL
ncbi:MAG: SDR family oxidoreductase [Ruminococcus sp.]|nr:SDR family oxidoreductase [Ruminococcus sp.]MCC8174072.1 SDR family oxidoreductase [Odoribacter sp.]